MKASEHYKAKLAELELSLSRINSELETEDSRERINALAEQRKIVMALKGFAREIWEIDKADEIDGKLPEAKKTASNDRINRASKAPEIPLKGG